MTSITYRNFLRTFILEFLSNCQIIIYGSIIFLASFIKANKLTRMLNVYKLFNRSLKWNTIEAIVYQTVLTTHQVLLFSVINKTSYALIGTVFSLLYLSVIIANLGFDKSLATFFTDYTCDKHSFKKFFVSQFLVQLFLLILVSAVFIALKNTIGCLFATGFNCVKLPDLAWVILAILLTTESLKKTLRTFAQLAFLNKQTTIIESACIILYFTLVWGYYLVTGQVNILTILVPFVIESCASNICLFFVVRKFYQTLSNTSQEEHVILKIIPNRFYLYINQISHMFFTGNFIVPFLAHIFSLEQVSILKLTNHITVFITRIFGITTAALLTHVKDLKILERRKALNLSTKYLYSTLVLIFIFLIIYFIFAPIYLNLIPIYLFITLLFFENFFITYEQYLIVEEKSYYLMFINSTAAIFFYILLDKSSLSISHMLFALLIIRIIALLIIKFILSKKSF